MGTCQQTRNELSLSHLTGNPVFFFNTSYLLANAAALAGWNKERLDAAIAPRLDGALGWSDLRFFAREGFYLVFATRDTLIARETAYAIRDDLLRHFYGHGRHIPADMERFCRESSVENLAGSMGLPLAAPRPSRPGPARTAPAKAAPVNAEQLETEDEKLQFAKELTALFLKHLHAKGESEDYEFRPWWDCKKESITSFACEPIPQIGRRYRRGLEEVGLPAAVTQCKADVVALAAAIRGIRHVVSRGELATVSVPVSLETLSWSKTRNGYVSVLAQTDPRFLHLLIPRVVNIPEGSNLASLAQWTLAMRQHVRWYFVHLPNPNFDFSRVVPFCATALGLTITSAMRMTAIRSETLAAQLARLSRLCANQSAIAYADNVDSVRELFMLASRGVRMLSGSVIGKASELPGKAGPLSFVQVPHFERQARPHLLPI